MEVLENVKTRLVRAELLRYFMASPLSRLSSGRKWKKTNLKLLQPVRPDLCSKWCKRSFFLRKRKTRLLMTTPVRENKELFVTRSLINMTLFIRTDVAIYLCLFPRNSAVSSYVCIVKHVILTCACCAVV